MTKKSPGLCQKILLLSPTLVGSRQPLLQRSLSPPLWGDGPAAVDTHGLSPARGAEETVTLPLLMAELEERDPER